MNPYELDPDIPWNAEAVEAHKRKLRDHFAGLAMQAELKWDANLGFKEEDTLKIARGAYAMADAMLTAREKKP